MIFYPHCIPAKHSCFVSVYLIKFITGTGKSRLRLTTPRIQWFHRSLELMKVSLVTIPWPPMHNRLSFNVVLRSADRVSWFREQPGERLRELSTVLEKVNDTSFPSISYRSFQRCHQAEANGRWISPSPTSLLLVLSHLNGSECR